MPYLTEFRANTGAPHPLFKWMINSKIISFFNQTATKIYFLARYQDPGFIEKISPGDEQNNPGKLFNSLKPKAGFGQSGQKSAEGAD